MNIQILDAFNPLWGQILQQLDCDVYHLPEYSSIEAARIQAIPEAFLAVEGDKIFFVPYLVRKCSEIFSTEAIAEDVFDAISPYGYPGFLYNEAARSDSHFLDLATQSLLSQLADRGVCSAFLRFHPILNRDLLTLFPDDRFAFTNNGETISINLELTESQIWSDTRDSYRSKINRCKRNGMVAKIVDYQQYLAEFMTIYQETMDRVAANQSYYFTAEYFQGLLKLGDRVHLCVVEWESQIICASLLFEHNGIVQYHLGGTKNDFLKLAPNTLMFDFIRYWAKERGNSHFHVGGGLGGATDSLHHFKAGFSKQRYRFFTLRLITQKEKYLQLVDLRAKSLQLEPEKLLQTNFFPVYRFSV